MPISKTARSRPPIQLGLNRRLTDKILAAFDHACDNGEADTAGELLQTLELLLLRAPLAPERREAVLAPLLASHERLWRLKNAAHVHGHHVADMVEAAYQQAQQ